MEILRIAGSIITLAGSIFLFLGALGVLRMPDLYNRMQSGTKTTTLGTILTLLGIGLYHPAWIFKMIIIIAFVVITNPVSSHALARAAHFSGVPLVKGSVVDRLSEEYLVRVKDVDPAALDDGSGGGPGKEGFGGGEEGGGRGRAPNDPGGIPGKGGGN
jgi:multicomponent Na+:H+ antiporter subunit G